MYYDEETGKWMKFGTSPVSDAYWLFQDQIHNQPERTTPEDKNWFGMKAEVKEDGLCYFEDGTIIDPSQPIDVCDVPTSDYK